MVPTSPEEQDMAGNVELGAVGYVVKCVDYGLCREEMKTLGVYLAPARSLENLDVAPR